MAYSTAAEVQADFKNITFDDDASTNVKLATVTQFIVEADSLINSYVGSIYVVPVTAGDALNLLKLLSRSLVAARIKSILEVKQQQNPDPDQNVRGVLLSPSQVMKILSDIQKQVTALAGATLLSSDGGFYSNNQANCVEPVVRKDDKQW